jgi:hypothetical protein
MPRRLRLIFVASALVLALAPQSPVFAACGIDGDCKISAPGTGLRTYREDHPPGADRGQAISEAAKSEPGQRAENVHVEECLAVDAGFAIDVPFSYPVTALN